jgi:HlyD family secretion protein
MPEYDEPRAVRRHVRAAALAAGLLLFGLGGWAATTELAGAVIAAGQIVVKSEVKKVQHPNGGVVSEIHVREGSVVKANELLVKLDETAARSALSIIVGNLDEARVQEARNLAEREGLEQIRFPADILDRQQERRIATLIAGEERLFQTRREARIGQTARLNEQVEQIRQQIAGITEQIGARTQEITLIQRELTGIRDLYSRQLVSLTRLTTLEREAARLTGERGQLTAAISVARGRMAELELQVIQIERDLRNETGRELAELRRQITELLERRVAAEEQLRRTEIRSPQDGVVTQLTVHAPGAVITPSGEAIMLIVPRGDELTVEARVSPQEIDRLYMGQQAIVRFPSFNRQTTPEVRGSIVLISADVRRDQRTGVSYYVARVDLPPDEQARLKGLTLIPGMPAETFIHTDTRTVASYLLRPIFDQLTRAFRER